MNRAATTPDTNQKARLRLPPMLRFLFSERGKEESEDGSDVKRTREWWKWDFLDAPNT